MKLKYVAALAAAVTLSGCQTYYLDGKPYNSRDAFLNATDQRNQTCIREIESYPAPLLDRSVVIYIPTEEFLIENRYKNIKPVNSNVTRQALRNDLTGITFLMNQYRQLAERLKKKNIYTSVDTVEYSIDSEPQPTSRQDVLYMGLAQGWGARDVLYMYTAKNGRQIVPFNTQNPRCSVVYEDLFQSVLTSALAAN